MRPLDSTEVIMISSALESWVGSQLQDVFTSERDLVLEFYRAGQKAWIWIDLETKSPLVLPLTTWPKIRFQKRTRPLQLFLRSHARSRYLTEVSILSEWRIQLRFGQSDWSELELHLQPRNANVKCVAAGKSIWWHKPMEPFNGIKSSESDRGTQDIAPRTLKSLEAEWLESRTRRTRAEKQTTPEALLEKELKKKTKLLGTLQEEFAANQAERWAEAGEWLKAQGEMVIPSPFPECIDEILGFAENLERIFAKAKKQKRKVVGIQERIRMVEADIERLQGDEGLTALAKKQGRERTGQWLKEQGVQAGHIEIGADLKFFIGKSGADNLKLLRKARAWDYWIHLKNYPGAHGILQRPKGRVVQREEFERAGQWVIGRSLGKKRELNMGARFELIVAECRHVRPIKGDRLGRVTFRNEQIFAFVYNGEGSGPA